MLFIEGTTALFGIAVTNSKTEAGIGLALARLRLNTQYKRHVSCTTCPDFANGQLGDGTTNQANVAMPRAGGSLAGKTIV
ncbi:MAG: hypothetical protein O3C12_00025 [Proteobacteria bacterium]|nr:hypothetical protein [Pseudomonadota bacterium]